MAMSDRIWLDTISAGSGREPGCTFQITTAMIASDAATATRPRLDHSVENHDVVLVSPVLSSISELWIVLFRLEGALK